MCVICYQFSDQNIFNTINLKMTALCFTSMCVICYQYFQLNLSKTVINYSVGVTALIHSSCQLHLPFEVTN